MWRHQRKSGYFLAPRYGIYLARPQTWQAWLLDPSLGVEVGILVASPS